MAARALGQRLLLEEETAFRPPEMVRLIVRIGASAGGLDAFLAFIALACTVARKS